MYKGYYMCGLVNVLPSSHGWSVTAHFRAAGKVDSLGPLQSNQFLGRGRGGCEFSQHSFHNNDGTTLTSSLSWGAAAQRYISVDRNRREKKEEPDWWPWHGDLFYYPYDTLSWKCSGMRCEMQHYSRQTNSLILWLKVQEIVSPRGLNVRTLCLQV